MRDQWEAAVRDIAAYRAARQPALDPTVPGGWAVGAPTGEPVVDAHRERVLAATSDTMWTLTARRLADTAQRPPAADTTPLNELAATEEAPTAAVTAHDVAAATAAAARTAAAVKTAQEHLTDLETRRAPGLRRNRGHLAEARQTLAEATAAHQAARAAREATKARELEARSDRRRHAQGLPSGPRAVARAEHVRHDTLTNPPAWLRAAVTTAAAAGAGTALAGPAFARWASDVAIYRELRGLDEQTSHPLGTAPRGGPLAAEHTRLQATAPIPVPPPTPSTAPARPAPQPVAAAAAGRHRP